MTTYYVDSTTGNDADDGLSEANAKQTIAAALALLASGDTCAIKAAAAYTIGTGLTTPAGVETYRIVGYGSTIGDGVRPVIRASSAITMLTARSRGRSFVEDLELDGDGLANTGILAQNEAGDSNVKMERCVVHDCTGIGFTADLNLGSAFQAYRCLSYNNNVGFGFAGRVNFHYWGCEARDNVSHGFWGVQGAAVNCIAHRNGGFGFNILGPSSEMISGCIAYDNGSHGFGTDDFYTRSTAFLGCISYGNGGYGYYSWFADQMRRWFSAAGSNTSGPANNVADSGGNATLTADPFVDGPNGDFNLNNTAGGGAVLRAVTMPLPA